MKNSMSIGTWDRERFASLASYLLALKRREAKAGSWLGVRNYLRGLCRRVPMETRYPSAEAAIAQRRGRYAEWVMREQQPVSELTRIANVVRAKFGRRA